MAPEYSQVPGPQLSQVAKPDGSSSPQSFLLLCDFSHSPLSPQASEHTVGAHKYVLNEEQDGNAPGVFTLICLFIINVYIVLNPPSQALFLTQHSLFMVAHCPAWALLTLEHLRPCSHQRSSHIVPLSLPVFLGKLAVWNPLSIFS